MAKKRTAPETANPPEVEAAKQKGQRRTKPSTGNEAAPVTHRRERRPRKKAADLPVGQKTKAQEKGSPEFAPSENSPYTFLGWTWQVYLRQLLVVIVGIAVTFGGSQIITDLSRQREVKAIMERINIELSNNLSRLDHEWELIKETRKSLLLLKRSEGIAENVSLDSLKIMCRIIWGTRLHKNYAYDAFEILKTSNLRPYMRGAGENPLTMLESILTAYRKLEQHQQTLVAYDARREEALEHFRVNSPIFEQIPYDPRPWNKRSGWLLNDDDPCLFWNGFMADPLCARYIELAHYQADYDNGDFYGTRRSVDKALEEIRKKFLFPNMYRVEKNT